VVALSRRAAALVLAAVLVVEAGSALAAPPEYGPPYREGPSGGDQWNYIDADAQAGRVTILRLSPFPGFIGCDAAGGYANFEVRHRAAGPVGSVVVAYGDSMWDAYSFVTVLVKTTRGQWLGARKVRGPVVGAGEIDVPLVGGRVRRGTSIRVLFGLELAAACPSGGGGSIAFTSVVVQPKGRR
jgi:hypothetical protein